MASCILTGGGTAGHCTPNLALIPYLKKSFDNIYYVGSENGIEKSLVEKIGIPYFATTCVKLRREISFNNFLIPFKLIKGIKQSEQIIDKLKPDVIFSKGGFVAVPTVIAGKRKGVPVISHESDLTVGLANKITAKYCDKVLTSFPETAKSLKNGVYVGSPIRPCFLTPLCKQTALHYFGFTGNKPVILITGGSQGAKRINDVVRSVLPHLLNKYDVIHVCGKGNLLNTKTPQGYYQTEFLNNIEYAFSACDICVTRAGSNALFELLYMKIPCLLIPLPKNCSRGDQILNANYFTEKGCTFTLLQDDLTENSFLEKVDFTFNNKDVLISSIKRQKIENANKIIADIISDYKR